MISITADLKQSWVDEIKISDTQEQITYVHRETGYEQVQHSRACFSNLKRKENISVFIKKKLIKENMVSTTFANPSVWQTVDI